MASHNQNGTASSSDNVANNVIAEPSITLVAKVPHLAVKRNLFASTNHVSSVLNEVPSAVDEKSPIPVPPQLATTMSQDGAATSKRHPLVVHDHVNINSSQIIFDESKSRLAFRMLLRSSKSSWRKVRLYLKKPTAGLCRLDNFMSTVKRSVTNSLMKVVPSTQAINQITSSLMKTLQGERFSECMRFLGLLPSSSNKYNKVNTNSSSSSSSTQTTFLNPVKKPELPQTEAFQFIKPKIYECGVCRAKYFKLPIYLKHIKRHATLIGCPSCNKIFSSVINMKKHRMQCQKRAIL